MKTMNFQVSDEDHAVIKEKAKRAQMSLKNYFVTCAKVANVEVVVKVSFDSKVEGKIAQ